MADALEVRLRDVIDADLPVFFEQQRDPAAFQMAAFTAKDPDDRAAFDAHWARLRATSSIVPRTILCDGHVAGSILKFEEDRRPEVTYWIGRRFWGRGVATRALSQFLGVVTARPIYGRAACDNAGSIRVLEKCGFVTCSHARGFANARGAEIAEVVLVLAAPCKEVISARGRSPA